MYHDIFELLISSTNDTTTLNDTITVEVQGECDYIMCVYSHMILLLYSFTVPPELNISATSTRIAIGQSTNLTCTISRSVPIDPTIEWTMTDLNNITTTLNETGMTLMIINITEDEFGDYTCTAINSAGLSGSDNITIEQGCKLHLIYIYCV